MAAAHRLFLSQGYLSATIDEVAREAGVSRPTVFLSVGGKPQLLKLVRDVAIAGDDRPVAVPDRGSFQQVWDEPDPRRTLQLYARNMRVIHTRAAEVEHLIASVAGTDPELAELAATALRQRRHGCGLVARSVASKGRLRSGLSVEAAGDVLFAMASPEVFRSLTGPCGWSGQRYERWLGAALARELLAG